jgi:hypothetical protein
LKLKLLMVRGLWRGILVESLWRKRMFNVFSLKSKLSHVIAGRS